MTTEPAICRHPRSCQACSIDIEPCGRHRVGTPGHEWCSGKLAPPSVTVSCDARRAKELSALLSPTRNFHGTDMAGVFTIRCTDEVQALRDADYLTGIGVTVLTATV